MEILVPIFICAILPISIVLILAIRQMKANRLRADIILKAIESESNVDVSKLAESLGKPKLTPQEMMTRKLLNGCIFTLLGMLFCIIGIVAWANGCEFSEDSVEIPLLGGGISLSVGISFLIVYFVNRRQDTGNSEKIG